MLLIRLLRKIFILLIAAFIIFYLVRADTFLGMQGLLPIAPITLFVTASSPLFGLGLLGMLRENRFIAVFYRCRTVLLPFLALVVISLLSAVMRWGGSATGSQLFYPVLDFYVFLVGVLVAALTSSKPLWRTVAFWGLGITVGTIFIDVVKPYTFALPGQFEAAAGLSQNPNGGAYVTLLLLTATLNWQKRAVSLVDGAVIAVALAAILFTGSRSGILLAVGVAGLYFFHARKSLRPRSLVGVVLLGILGSVSVAFGFPALLESSPTLDTGSSKIAQLLDPSSDVSNFRDLASELRVDAIRESIALISESPILGAGTGTSYDMPVGPHNMYLSRAVDNGLIGLIAYLWLLAAALLANRRNQNFEGVMLALLMILIGLFSHNVLEDRTMILLLAISTATAVSECAKKNLAKRLTAPRSEARPLYPVGT